MKNFRIRLTGLIASALVLSCAHSSGVPKVDRTFKYQPTELQERVGLPPCKVSVPLTQDEALEVARLGGAPNLDQRPDWSEMIATMETGDQLRYVWCIPRGRGGVVFFALYRGDTMIRQLHTVMLD